MDFTNAVDRSARYRVFRPIFINDDVVGVLEGDYVLGAVPLKTLTAVRIEQRTSFKHPVIGTLMGALLVTLGIPPLAEGIEIHIPSPVPTPLAAAASVFLCGLYLLWNVVRRREQLWVVFVSGIDERAFPIEQELTPDAMAVLDSVVGTKSQGTK